MNVFGRVKNIYFKRSNKLFSFHNHILPESVVWAYRLFLDREPESPQVVIDKLSRLTSTQDLRQDFVNSEEFQQKNPALLYLSLSGSEPPLFIERVSDLRELFLHIQKAWEYLGETEPHWSVLSSERFKASKIGETRSEFYNSGFADVTKFFKTLERNGIDYASFKTCLEYGCGLGRVTYWLAKRFGSVLGYDISRSHLRLAKQYLDETGIQNVSLRHISKPQEIENFPKVDVVYSVIVLQHNPPPIIRLIIEQMIKGLHPGGVAFFQVPTYRLGYRFSLNEYLANEATRSEMELHVLSQNEIFDIVSGEKGKIVEVLEDGCTGLRYGERSNTFVIQKEG